MLAPPSQISLAALTLNALAATPAAFAPTRAHPQLSMRPMAQGKLGHITPSIRPAQERSNPSTLSCQTTSPVRTGQSRLNGCYWPEGDYPDSALKAPLTLSFQSLGQHAYPIHQVDPTQCPEFPSTEAPDGTLVDLSRILTPGSVFMGLTETGIHIGKMTTENGIQAIAASACMFSQPNAQETQGEAPSGLYFVPKDLPPGLQDALTAAAKQLLVTTDTQPATNLERLVTLLTSPQCELTRPPEDMKIPPQMKQLETAVTIATPTPTPTPTLNACKSLSHLLEQLMQHGLSYKGVPIPLRLINTSSKSLHAMTGDVDRSVLTMPIKHCREYFETPETKQQRREAAERIRTSLPSADEQPVTEDPNQLINIAAAKTSPTGALLRRYITPHILFSLQLNPSTTQKHLPDLLKPFDQKKPDFMTRLKRDLLFPPETAKKVTNLMAEGFDKPAQVTAAELLSLLETQSVTAATHIRTHTRTQTQTQTPQRFNCVITDKSLILGQLKAQFEPIDDVLSKHVLLAEYKPVRFAGEIYVENDSLVLTRNSGTYRPTKAHLESAVNLLATQFPQIKVKADFKHPSAAS